jgi:hypothetical protein
MPAREALEIRKRTSPLLPGGALHAPIREGVRRLRRSTLVFVAIVASLIAYSWLVAPIGFPNWLIAILAAYVVAFLTLFWPARQRTGQETKAAPDRDDLAGVAEAMRRARGDRFPQSALPATDAILARLDELRPYLKTLDPHSQTAGDAQRLIGRHLPKLIETYLALPPSARAGDSDCNRRFTRSLDIVANELGALLEHASRGRHQSFETQWRFIESRYDDEGLRAD